MPTLDRKEVESIKTTLGHLTNNMASLIYQTVAKLYLCSPECEGWKDTGVWGALCLVMDRTPPASKHVKILDLKTLKLKFSQELYEAMPYAALHPQFLAFEVDNAIAGFSFADAEEADIFLKRLKSFTPQPSPEAVTNASTTTERGFFARLFGLGKPQIGLPTNVVHKKHIGYEPGVGFDVDNPDGLPEEWKNIFRSAGIQKKDLRDPEKAAVIYSTLQNTLGPHMPAGFPGLAQQQQQQAQSQAQAQSNDDDIVPHPPATAPPVIKIGGAVGQKAPASPPAAALQAAMAGLRPVSKSVAHPSPTPSSPAPSSNTLHPVHATPPPRPSNASNASAHANPHPRTTSAASPASPAPVAHSHTPQSSAPPSPSNASDSPMYLMGNMNDISSGLGHSEHDMGYGYGDNGGAYNGNDGNWGNGVGSEDDGSGGFYAPPSSQQPHPPVVPAGVRGGPPPRPLGGPPPGPPPNAMAIAHQTSGIPPPSPTAGRLSNAMPPTGQTPNDKQREKEERALAKEAEKQKAAAEKEAKRKEKEEKEQAKQKEKEDKEREKKDKKEKEKAEKEREKQEKLEKAEREKAEKAEKEKAEKAEKERLKQEKKGKSNKDKTDSKQADTAHAAAAGAAHLPPAHPTVAHAGGHGAANHAHDAYDPSQYDPYAINGDYTHDGTQAYDPNLAYANQQWDPSQQGYDQQGYDQQGYDQQGYDQQGYDQQGYEAHGQAEPAPTDPKFYWTEMRLEDGTVYYSNSLLEITSWDKPFDIMTDEEKAAAGVTADSSLQSNYEAYAEYQAAYEQEQKAAAEKAAAEEAAAAAAAEAEAAKAATPVLDLQSQLNNAKLKKVDKPAASAAAEPAKKSVLPTNLSQQQESSVMGALKAAMANRFRSLNDAEHPTLAGGAAAPTSPKHDDWDDD